MIDDLARTREIVVWWEDIWSFWIGLDWIGLQRGWGEVKQEVGGRR